MQLVTGESVLISESLAPYESLRVFFEVADERGHGAPSVLVDERGEPLTHPDYVDRMGAAHLQAGAWAFCRRPAAEAFGLPSGTDWVRDHSLALMFQAGSPYLPQPHLHDQVYVQRFGEDQPVLLAPVSSATPVAWSNEGSRICVLEIRLGHVADNTGMAGYLLWEYELVLGRRRLIASFPASARLDFTQVAYSCDDSWIHLCEWTDGRNLLIRVADGLVVTLPVVSTAVSWNSRNGPSAMIVMTLDGPTGRLVIYDYDVAANMLAHRSDLESPTGLPLSVRELSMSADGSLGLVTAPVGVPGLEQGARGGVHVAAVIDIDEGSIEPVLPVAFRTRSAQRRHTSPRWCGEQPRQAGPASITIAGQLMQNASQARCEDDSPAVTEDLLERSAEILEGVAAAWSSGRMPPARFAGEYVQHALTCYQLDERAAEQAVTTLRLRARADLAARAVIRAIDSFREHQWRPTTALPRPEPLTVAAQPAAAAAGITTSVSASVGEDALAVCLDRLIAAHSLGDAAAAGRALRQAAGPGSSDSPWRILAQASDEALDRGSFSFAAKLGLATVFWQSFFRPELAASGLPQAPVPLLLPILLNCFEACTHLPERATVGADAQSIFDVEDTRNRCQQALSGLPLADYLTAAPRKRLAPDRGPSRVPSPAQDGPAEGGSPVALRKRVFISYVHEDAETVDRLASALISNGLDVWLDRTHLLPGMRWKSVIRKAIRSGDYFIACFSASYVSKTETFMNEELNIAIDRLRMMHRSRQWFFPVMLQECDIPDYEIGPGETLDSLQYLDFSRDWDTAVKKLVAALSLESA
jgi:TIR domain